MSAVRICLVAIGIWGLYACTSEGDIPHPQATNESPGSAPLANADAVAPEPPLPAPAAPRSLKVTSAPPAASKVVPPAAKRPAPIAPAALTLDLNALKKQLKATKSIGLFGKIALKNQVDDLLGQFRKYYKGKAKVTLPELRVSYNLLMMKVLSLVQDEDQQLASAIVLSRDAIWELLADPVKFATLDI